MKTERFDIAELLDDELSQAEVISEALQSGDASLIAATVGAVARARGMASVAEEAGVNRESLYRALGKNGNPRLSTLVSVLNALGMRLEAHPAKDATPAV